MGVPRFFRWISERYPLINGSIDFENSGPIIDNLYLDMNGIIHNCSHANTEDLEALAALTDDDIIIRIFQYIDRLFNITKPQRLLYMAIDGVAPRAKMNQQRQRRFKSVKEAEERLKKLVDEGQTPPESSFDSNCITPGTEFMEKISEYLRFFIKKKITEDAHWRSIEIIFSGSEVPGEGEHKIMDYIRNSKAQPEWEFNQVHCIYGLDADLIMLSLVTHEPNFCLLREEGVLDRKFDKRKQGEQQEFHLLHISLLREYLELEFSFLKELLPFEYDFERIIDDWILLCFLMGNDFIPSLPGLDIGEGSLNQLLELYMSMLPHLDGYLSDKGQPIGSRMQYLFAELATTESAYFAIIPDEIETISREILDNNQEQSELANVLFGAPHLDSFSFGGLNESSEVDAYWKYNYYNQKFNLDYVEDYDKIQQICVSYLEALCWIDHYYYHGCVSWGWFYPYHYPPLVSDLIDVEWNISFELSQPFSPLQQLISVLPPKSGKLFLPDPYYQLMNDPDMKHHYPTSFDLDLNGKKYDWEAIALISFLDADLIFKKTKEANKYLSEIETKRNSFGDTVIFHYNKKTKNFVKSEIPFYFPDILNCHARQEILILPKMDNPDPFTTIWGHETKLPPGIPSLHSVQFKYELSPVHVNIFGNKSRKDSMLLMVDEENEDDVKSVLKFLKKDCFLWPFNRQGKIVGVSTGDTYYASNKQIKGDNKEKANWERDISQIKKKWHDEKAVHLGPIKTVVSVRKLIGISRERNGELYKRYDSEVEKYPLSLIFRNSLNEEDPRFDDTYGDWETEFPVNSKCISVRKGQSFGNVCTVIKHDNSQNNHRVQVSIENAKHPIEIIEMALSQNPEDIFYSQSTVAKKLAISVKSLSKITAIVMFQPGNINLGLKLKFSGKFQQTLGYTRRTMNQYGNYNPWEYSEKTVTILKEYKSKFPEVFKLLQERPEMDAYDSRLLYDSLFDEEPNSDNISSSDAENSADDDVFVESLASLSDDDSEEVVVPQKSGVHPRIKEAQEYIKSLGVWKKDQVDCGSSTLSSETISVLEQGISEWISNTNNMSKTKVDWIFPESLIRPIRQFEVSNGNIKRAYQRGIEVPDDDIQLGDRVTNLRDSGPMEYGCFGTIIGIQGKYLELLLDIPQVGGVTLYGKVPSLKGQVVSKGTVLNISQKYRTSQGKDNNTPKQKKKKISKSTGQGSPSPKDVPIPQFFPRPNESTDINFNWQQEIYFQGKKDSNQTDNNPKKKNTPNSGKKNQQNGKTNNAQNGTKKRSRKRTGKQTQKSNTNNSNQTSNAEPVIFFDPSKTTNNNKRRWVKKNE